MVSAGAQMRSAISYVPRPIVIFSQELCPGDAGWHRSAYLPVLYILTSDGLFTL